MVTTTSSTGPEPVAAPIDPEEARRAVAGLSESFGAGDYPQAEMHARFLLRLVPADANLRRILAAAEVAQGKTEPALLNLRRALLVVPDYIDGHYYLANTHFQANDVNAAIKHYGHALCLAPDHGETLINLGNAWAAQGDPLRARALFRRAAISLPGAELPIGNLGVLATTTGALADAARYFKQTHRVSPGAMATNLNLANALRDFDQISRAMPYYHQALTIAPGDGAALAAASEALDRLGGRLPSENPDATRAVTIACLASPLVESNSINLTSQALMTRDFSAWLSTGRPSGDIDDPVDLVHAGDGLVLHHLMDSLITDPNLEELLTRARHRLLLQHRSHEGSDAALARALGRQAGLNEYLWAVSLEEDAVLDTLTNEIIRAVEAGAAVDPLDIHLLAAYRPLAPLGSLRHWAAGARETADADFAEDLDFLILDRVREEAIAATIVDLTPIDDAVSTLVKAQYEDNPYPRWNSLARHEPIDPIEQILGEIAPNKPNLDPMSERPGVLIAGCGTGRQAVQAAMTYRGASVLAIDLSHASLAHAKRKADQLGFDDIRFARADILGLNGIPDRFEIIECSGVLHHMADPEAGLRALLSVLAPKGLLKIALYSAAARGNVTRLRQWIADQGFAPDLEGIRAFRQRLLDSGHPDAEATSRSIDYNATSAIRDLLFHAQEHQFTIPGLKRMLEDHRLEFLGFLFRDASVKADFLERFPDDVGCVDLDNWTRFEAEFPLTFVSMYQFWCRRADDGASS
jgi:SAM-dependent methyltransferase/Tfp pilus assembly protein PilF